MGYDSSDLLFRARTKNSLKSFRRNYTIAQSAAASGPVAAGMNNTNLCGDAVI